MDMSLHKINICFVLFGLNPFVFGTYNMCDYNYLERQVKGHQYCFLMC